MMQGTSSLSAYAGQTVILSGTGTLLGRNYVVLAEGAGELSAASSDLASATLTGSSYVYAAGYYPSGGTMVLPAMGSIGGDIPEGFGTANLTLPALTTEAFAWAYTPEPDVLGYGNLPPMAASGVIVASNPGEGNATLPAMASVGGDDGYGKVDSELPALTSFALYGLRNVAGVLSTAVLWPRIIRPTLDIVIVFDSSGTLTDTIVGHREYVQLMIDAIEGSSDFTMLGEFDGVITSGLLGDDITIGQIGTAPDLNTTSRVWVVNLDTFASSQYDDYGFESFFSYDGTSYGVAADGIYELSGTTDAGNSISSLVDFGTSDCGVSGRKKVLNVHVATTDGDGMYLKVETDSGTYTYALEACRRGASGWRAKLPQNVQGTHWNWTLISDIDFELTGVEFVPAKLSRRL